MVMTTHLELPYGPNTLSLLSLSLSPKSMDNHPQTELYISVIHGGHNDVTGSDFINFPSGGLPSNRQLSLASDFSDG